MVHDISETSSPKGRDYFTSDVLISFNYLKLIHEQDTSDFRLNKSDDPGQDNPTDLIVLQHVIIDG